MVCPSSSMGNPTIAAGIAPSCRIFGRPLRGAGACGRSGANSCEVFSGVALSLGVETKASAADRSGDPPSGCATKGDTIGPPSAMKAPCHNQTLSARGNALSRGPTAPSALRPAASGARAESSPAIRGTFSIGAGKLPDRTIGPAGDVWRPALARGSSGASTRTSVVPETGGRAGERRVTVSSGTHTDGEAAVADRSGVGKAAIGTRSGLTDSGLMDSGRPEGKIGALASAVAGISTSARRSPPSFAMPCGNADVTGVPSRSGKPSETISLSDSASDFSGSAGSHVIVVATTSSKD